MEMQETKKRSHDSLTKNSTSITITEGTDMHDNENGKVHTKNGKSKKFVSKKRMLHYGILFFITVCIIIIAFILYYINTSGETEKSKGIDFVKNSTIITNINTQTTKMYETTFQSTISIITPNSGGKISPTISPTTENYIIDLDKGDKTFNTTFGSLSTETGMKVTTTEISNVHTDFNYYSSGEQTSTVQTGYNEHKSTVITSTSDYNHGTTDSSDWPPFPDTAYEDTTPSDDEIGSGDFDDEDFFNSGRRRP